MHPKRSDIRQRLNLILLGPPGAGKGTQAETLRREFELPYIATGDMLRANVKERTDLGRRAKEFMDAGDLVPDDLIVAMAADRLKQDDAHDRFLLDGFPRTVEQAVALAAMLEELGRYVDAVLLIDVPDEEVIRRLSGRRVCTEAGHNYHVDFNPPERENICDQDGSPLIQRDDDKPDVIKHRLAIYQDKTQPLVEYYDRRGVLLRIDGARKPADVSDQITAAIRTLRSEGDV